MNLHDAMPPDPWAHIPLMTHDIFEEIGPETRGRLYETRVIDGLPYGIWSPHPAQLLPRYVIYLNEWEDDPENAEPQYDWYLYQAHVMNSRYRRAY